MLNNIRVFEILFIMVIVNWTAISFTYSSSVDSILAGIRNHNFNHNSGYEGVGNLDDSGWQIRTLAIRDLVRLGDAAVPDLRKNLLDKDSNVRHVCTKVLGLLKSVSAIQELQHVLKYDEDPVVRGEAAQSLGQLGGKELISLLEEQAQIDKSRHVKHRCELAIGRIRKGIDTANEEAEQYGALDESTFRTVEVGKPAPDFTLNDTNGISWSLSKYKGQTVALIWIFADWCPVCRNEFHDLMELEQQFKEDNIQVMTIECHDRYRCQSMVGDKKIWWPHLVDTAGAVGLKYGVDPMEFIVHDEWINRPSTIIIDKEGIVRFAYYGTYWGDRPSIKETLTMIHEEKYEFVHPERRAPKQF